MKENMKTLTIVGAGVSGIITARIFKQYGFDVTVYEKETEVGGVWASSRSYPGLRTQNPKDTYHFSELKMPKSYPAWPEGHQVQAYLDSYVEQFDLRQNIVFNTQVTRCTQTASGQWSIETENQTKEKNTTTTDYLIVCNGVYSVPNIPQFKGAEAFTNAGGQIYHSSEQDATHDTKNKKVVVVGYGKSACDSAIANLEMAESMTIVTRSLLWKVPYKFLNLLNFKYILLTRLGENLAPYIRSKGFAKFLNGAGAPIKNALLRSVQALITSQLQLKKTDLLPKKPLISITDASISLATDGFFEKVAKNEITVHKNVEIAELKVGKVILTDGTSLDADTIICGTGWKQEIPFLDSSIMSKLLDNNGDFLLYKNQYPLGTKNLAFNGYNSSLYCQLTSEIGAIWLAEVFTGGIKLPSEADMKKVTSEQLAWSNERTNGKNTRGTNLVPFTSNHIDELLADTGIDISSIQKFIQWQIPLNPTSYVKVRDKILKRYEVERKSAFMNDGVK
jgi:dimethylaniline monooxygenase (N-oxide forming)